MFDRPSRFPIPHNRRSPADPRRAALAQALRDGRIVRLMVGTAASLTVHPDALELRAGEWVLICALGRRLAEADWGDANISARRFASPPLRA
jgi:hypothetical protein